MLVARTVDEVRSIVGANRREGRRIGLVPTMGYLHEGHLSLVRQAAAECDCVVLSIFVNPTQFPDPGDLAAYPRDEARDVDLAAGAGVHAAFVPTASEMYPDGFATSVRIDGHVTESLEGASRGPTHFWGVATVVTKLLNTVQPDVAYFGQKDAQQCVVVRRLVSDLDLPVRIAVCPTVREPDGLAMSSRNVRLCGPDRERALALVEGLGVVEAGVEGGDTDVPVLVDAAIRTMAARGVTPEYFAVVDPDTLVPVDRVDDRVLVAVAARVGPVRLIDNMLVEPKRG